MNNIGKRLGIINKKLKTRKRLNKFDQFYNINHKVINGDRLTKDELNILGIWIKTRQVTFMKLFYLKKALKVNPDLLEYII